jgi:regulator of protease activity HflC (stomatin/prohibitin superfamily)
MHKDMWMFMSAVSIATFPSGCASQDIPQMYRGRMFERISPAAAYGDKAGFTGPVLGPGSYDVSSTGEIHKVECSTVTARNTLASVTKDGVPIGLKVYVRFHADCTDDGVEKLLDALPVDENNTITAARIFQVYVQPEIGALARAVFSPLLARDVYEKREALLEDVRGRILRVMAEADHHVIVEGVNFSDVTLPPDLQKANIELAVQAAQQDKAAAERDRIPAETKKPDGQDQRAGAWRTQEPQDPAAKGAAPAANHPATSADVSDAAPAPDENPYH